MPYSPGTRCSDPLCGELATFNGKCEKHKRKPWINPSQHTLQMDPTLERQWRKQVIAKTNGRCAQCGQPGTITDHIVPVGEGGAKYDPANGQYLCQGCDTPKTQADLARMASKRNKTKKSKLNER